MSKADTFRQKAEELQKKLHLAAEDTKQLRALIKEHDDQDSKRRALCRNLDEGLMALGRSLSGPQFEIDRMVAGYCAALNDGDLK